MTTRDKSRRTVGKWKLEQAGVCVRKSDDDCGGRGKGIRGSRQNGNRRASHVLYVVVNELYIYIYRGGRGPGASFI